MNLKISLHTIYGTLGVNKLKTKLVSFFPNVVYSTYARISKIREIIPDTVSNF